MTQTVYSRDELMAEHPYAKPQIEAGYRLHGGFDTAGTYISRAFSCCCQACTAGQRFSVRGEI